MTRLLDRTPFSEHTGEVAFGGKQVVIRADQIIAWVSLTPFRVKEQNPIVVPFPVIVDTGYNHTFSILERHLVEWTGLRPEALHAVAAVRDRGQRLMLREANLWMHVNETRKRDRLAGVEPHMLAAPRGIAIYPDGDFPRLPILGLRAIAVNGLILKVNGQRREATIRTAWKWWPFG